MIGAIIGDLIGSKYEFNNLKNIEDYYIYDFKNKITDDTILNFATVAAYLYKWDYKTAYYNFGNQYDIGYGPMFRQWLNTPFKDAKPYNSLGNGAAMRICALPHLIKDLDILLDEVEKSCLPTHNHDDGITGAKAFAEAMHLALYHKTKEEIKNAMTNYFSDEELDRTVESYIGKGFDVSCLGTVNQALICFLNSENFEDCLKKAIYSTGDTDTVACISCALAECYYGVESINKELIHYAESFIINDQYLNKIYNDYKKFISIL